MKEAVTTTILQNVVVLSMGKQTEIQSTDPANASKALQPQRSNNPSATLMVTPDEAKKLELAKNQGKISLVLRNPLDHSMLEENSSVTAEAIDPILYAGSSRSIRGSMRIPNVRNDQVWNQITGADQAPPVIKPKEEKKEPPKPRIVVDVYRGDKHVQELFQ
jgi:Flp pilus assembly protein CpaB